MPVWSSSPVQPWIKDGPLPRIGNAAIAFEQPIEAENRAVTDYQAPAR